MNTQRVVRVIRRYRQ